MELATTGAQVYPGTRVKSHFCAHGGYYSVIALAILIRLWLLSAAGTQVGVEQLLTMTPDSARYLLGAQSLVDGTGDFRLVAFSFGPGYSLFLAVFLFLFDNPATPILLTQIVISGLSAGNIYAIARRLSRRSLVGAIAGVLCALSVTGSVLSCLALSDTLYFFLFSSALLLFLVSIDTGRVTPGLLSGFLFGSAILTRTIGQFWPLAMIVFLLTIRYLLPRRKGGVGVFSKRRLRGGWIAVGVTLAIEAAWLTRNVVVHGVPALAFISAGGPATIAALSYHPGDEGNYRQTMDRWLSEYLAERGETSITPEDHFRLLQGKARETFAGQPLAVMKAYVKLTWINMNEIDYLHFDMLPKWKSTTSAISGFIRQHHLNQTWVVLSIVGLGICLASRRWRLSLVLGGCYLYYALLCGAFPWQGSRLFYQSEIASNILAAIFIAMVIDISRIFFTRHDNKKTAPLPGRS